MKETILLIILLINLNTYSQEKKCSDYKVGKFTYTNPIYKNWKILRNETEQIETDKVNKIELRASINWVSACEYILTYTKFNDSENHSIVGQKINVKIIKVGNESVICESEGLGAKLELEMVLEKEK
ncbi:MULTISPECIES: hypothetical protein [unclassified Flavobacterium]|uniref:hypothetical protein n=1 Tax=unclassified Flavobacterium TaxID=196869 RepID=UPI002B233FE5|nr:hypothetical protein [Flavobacterium sp. PL02]MEA9414025.1 hypothetical protein [Flavobacterium sp. PL02]